MSMASDITEITYELVVDEALSNPLFLRFKKNNEDNLGQDRHSISKDQDECIVCSTLLLSILLRKEVKAIVVTPGRPFDGPKVVIDGTSYIHDYISGYKRGIAFFEKEYRVEPSVIYGSTTYAETLYQRCYYTTHEGDLGGWYALTHCWPVTISASQIHRYGYYSGIYSQIEELKQKHDLIKTAFEKLDKTSTTSKITVNNRNDAYAGGQYMTEGQISKRIEVLSKENNKSITLRALEQLERIPGAPPIPAKLPDYRELLREFDQRYPSQVDKDVWQKVRWICRDHYYDDIDTEIIEKQENLKYDNDRRVNYLRGLLYSVYGGKKYCAKLKRLGDFLFLPTFERFQAEMDIDLWCELSAIGYAAAMAATYTEAADNAIEKALRKEGIKISDNWLYDKPEESNHTEGIFEDLTIADEPRSTAITLPKNTFVDLLCRPDDIDNYVDTLRKVTQRNRIKVIDDAGNWIGKKGSISILIAWVEVLEQRTKFKNTVSYQEMAEMLNIYFPNLKLKTDETSMWRKLTPTRNKYHAEFLQVIK